VEASFYSPGKRLKSLKIPTLVQVGITDKTTPAKAAINACKKSDVVELKTYQLGHFEPYVNPYFSEIISDQISFLKQLTQ
jgi:poly(3-hydroxyalkanoate) synthetase